MFRAFALIGGATILGLVVAVMLLVRALRHARQAPATVPPPIDPSLQQIQNDASHRFRNALQTISALLGLQRDAVRDAVALRELDAAIGRVGAVSRFYQGRGAIGNIVAFDEIARGLVIDIQMKNDPNAEVALTVELSPLDLPLERAIPLSVLLNEIVTNAFRHAFKNVTEPHLTIRLTTTAGTGEAELVVVDSGIGIAEPPPERLGLRIVRAFARQLGGQTLLHGSTAEDGHGTMFSIAFRLEQRQR